MPQYFFHIRHPGRELVLDEEGQACEGLDAARHEAGESVRDLAIDMLRRGSKLTDFAIEIADESGGTLDTVHSRVLFA